MRYSVSPRWNETSLGPNPIENRTAFTPTAFPTSRCPSSWKNTTTLITSAKESRVKPADCTKAPMKLRV